VHRAELVGTVVGGEGLLHDAVRLPHRPAARTGLLGDLHGRGRRPRARPQGCDERPRSQAQAGVEKGQRIEKPLRPSGGSAPTSTRATAAPRGPSRQRRASDSTASGSPSTTTSTVPSGRLRTQPPSPRARAARSTKTRKPTPCTRPWTISRRRTG